VSDFGCFVNWIALEPQGAADLAAGIIRCARALAIEKQQVIRVEL
jgi:hypothetical protein